jgi:hypothetical protein
VCLRSRRWQSSLGVVSHIWSHTATGLAWHMHSIDGLPLTAPWRVSVGSRHTAIGFPQPTHQCGSLATALLSPGTGIQQCGLLAPMGPPPGKGGTTHRHRTVCVAQQPGCPPQWRCDPLGHTHSSHGLAHHSTTGSGCVPIDLKGPSGQHSLTSEHALVTLRHRQLGAEYPLAGQLR